MIGSIDGAIGVQFQWYQVFGTGEAAMNIRVTRSSSSHINPHLPALAMEVRTKNCIILSCIILWLWRAGLVSWPSRFIDHWLLLMGTYEETCLCDSSWLRWRSHRLNIRSMSLKYVISLYLYANRSADAARHVLLLVDAICNTL